MRVTVTGASGLIGSLLTRALLRHDARITIVSRDPDRARRALASQSDDAPSGAAAPVFERWDPLAETAPTRALAGRDAVVHLAGENIAQRWTEGAKRAIRESRVRGTENLVRGLAECPPAERPRVLLSASAIGYYGAHHEEPIDEDAPAGEDFLARLCAEWEARAGAAESLGMRVVMLRTGVVLDARGGALAKMLPPFKLGLGGPVASGRQYVSWVHAEDVVGVALAAISDERWRGAVNVTAPEPVTNRDFSKALGRVLRRPAVLPVPELALRLLYGDMARIVTTGARVLPAKALVLGYEFRHPQLQQALRSALSR